MKRLLLTATALSLAACQAASTETASQTAPQLAPQAPSQQSDGVKAKNVILFIGDGMGVSTITAARIYEGQSQGKTGEEHSLSFETFPNVAMVKTYNLDAQVPDSAGTASAMNTGLMTNIGAINVQPGNEAAGCRDETRPAPVKIMDLAEAAGLSTGIVTSTRITHATPAAVYAHSESRGFERYSDMPNGAIEIGCLDIAEQLVRSDLEIALGGGRQAFKPRMRGNDKSLIDVWTERGEDYAYISNARELSALDPTAKQRVLGLFSNSHLPYHVDRNAGKDPSLTELTAAAIDNLDARDTGYFLMIEGGRIDHAHHSTNAYRALTDTVEFAAAVQAAYERTDPNETLILVTADHSHVFTIAGYPQRGNPILGLAKRTNRDGESKALEDAEGLPYTTLGYHNGPNQRDDSVLTDNAVQAQDYLQQTAVKMQSETHSGEDVVLYGTGPGSERVSGSFHQAKIFDIIVDSLDIRGTDEGE